MCLITYKSMLDHIIALLLTVCLSVYFTQPSQHNKYCCGHINDLFYMGECMNVTTDLIVCVSHSFLWLSDISLLTAMFYFCI